MYIKNSINQKALFNMVQKIKEVGSLQHFAISKNGETLANLSINPYLDTDSKQLFSLSKTFTSMAIGKAYDEGLLSLDDKLVDIFKDFLPEKLGNMVDELKVKDLLSMQTGHSHCVMQEIVASKNIIEKFLSLDLEYKPGTFFMYNNGASLILSFMINILTRKSIVEYLKPLFEALEITNYHCDQIGGVCLGAAGMHLDCESILKFGNFLLNKGKVNGKQIISEEYINQAIKPHASTSHDNRCDWSKGYGYHLWMADGGYRCDGMLGQYAIIYPEEKIVVAAISNVSDMQKEVDAFKEFIKVMNNTSQVESLEDKINSLYSISDINSKVLDFDKKTIKLQDNKLGINEIILINENNSLKVEVKGENAFSLLAGYKEYKNSKFIASGIKANVFAGMPLMKEEVIVSSYYLYNEVLEVVMLNHNTPLTQKMIIDFNKNEIVINNHILYEEKNK